MSEVIKVTEYELENSKNNLNKLLSEWSGVPIPSESEISSSKGDAAEAVKGCLDSTRQTKQSMTQLLQNSVAFFEALGVSFRESDEAAKQKIDTIVT